jgi:predicted nucleotidyltransferase
VNTPQQNPNLARLAAAATKLEPLLDQIAFVGGCVTGLLLTDPAAAFVRPTLDVDAIVAIGSYAEFTFLEDRLRELGFHQPHAEGAPVCRWMSGDLILDLMPTDSSILGFSNRWYIPALKNAQRIRIDAYEIRVITAPYFLATKLEAFHGRGKNDFRMSHDLEDIVTVLDGRPELVDEVRLAPADLQKYLSDQFGDLLSNRDSLEALPGHLLPDAASQQRLGLVLKRMKQLVLEG